MIRDGETLGFLHLFREIWRRDFEIVSGAVLEKDILAYGPLIPHFRNLPQSPIKYL